MVPAVINRVFVDIYLTGIAYTDFVIERILKAMPHDQLMQRIESGLQSYAQRIPVHEFQEILTTFKENPENFYTFMRLRPLPDPTCTICRQAVTGVLPITCSKCRFTEFTCEECMNVMDEGVPLPMMKLLLHRDECQGEDHERRPEVDRETQGN